jgi:hypothetical protein
VRLTPYRGDVARHYAPNAMKTRRLRMMRERRDPVGLHDRAFGQLIPATIWRELS